MVKPIFRVVFRVSKMKKPTVQPYFWIEIPAENKTEAILTAWKEMTACIGVLFSDVRRVELVEQIGQPNNTHLTSTPIAANTFLFRRGRLKLHGVPLEPLAKGKNVFKDEKMPIYDFVCSECEKQTEVMQKYTDPNPTCCGKETKRMVSKTSFALKGRGWAYDGYGVGNTNLAKK